MREEATQPGSPYSDILGCVASYETGLDLPVCLTVNGKIVVALPVI